MIAAKLDQLKTYRLAMISKGTSLILTAWPAQPNASKRALQVKIREGAVVRNKAIYLALGVRPDGTRGILGL